MSAANLIQYYADRAPEYEKIYHKPERQSDLARLREFVRHSFANRHVLEIACGTGYWTEILSESAASVHAVDINDEVLQIARSKPRLANSPKVHLARGDAYSLTAVPESSAALSVFWWSHIPRARIRRFLEVLHGKLRPGATVVFIDNCYVPGNSTPINRTDALGNTYQLRQLEDGSSHEVLKNFPTDSELRDAVAPCTQCPTIDFLEYYWILQYEL
ncbi:MAG: class I SAM-dependent methyltransferase [Limisphaerales bacterium]